MPNALTLLPAALILGLAAASPAMAQGGSSTMGGGSRPGSGSSSDMVPMQRGISPGAGAPTQAGPSSTGPTATESLTGTGRMGPDGQVPMNSPGAATQNGRVTGQDFPTSLDRPIPGQAMDQPVTGNQPLPSQRLVPGQDTVGTPAQRRHSTQLPPSGSERQQQGMMPDTRPTAPGRLPAGPAQRGPSEPADRQTGWIGQQPDGTPEDSPVMGGPTVNRPLNPELQNRNADDMLP